MPIDTAANAVIIDVLVSVFILRDCNIPGRENRKKEKRGKIK